MGAADANGLVVSYIQSLYWEFGSGCVLPRTGVLMQNRGASFSLDPQCAQSRSRPAGCRSTRSIRRSPCSKDGRVMAYGTMGGDGQPQTQAALFTRHVTFSQPLDKALDRAALAAGPHLGLDRTTTCGWNAASTATWSTGCMSAGHDVEMLDEAYSDTMGHAGAVVLHPDGTLEGAHDPRADGGAAGV